MRAATANTIAAFDRPAPSRAAGILSARLAGLAIACLFPALFWTALIWGIGIWLGAPLAPVTAGAICCSIALFVLFVCAPLILRAPA
jgi:hypothetical protein